MRKFIKFIIGILTFSIIITGCTSQSNYLKIENSKLKEENEQLKLKVSQMDKVINDLQVKSEDEAKKDQNLIINYIEVAQKYRFIEKENNILILPEDSSKVMRIAEPNTLSNVFQRAIVDNETWIFVQIPTHDSACNSRGWIREADTVAYTKDKVSSVQSDVEIRAGSETYKTFNFEDIKNTVPVILSAIDSGRLQEKRDGYCRISQTGGRDIWVKESCIIYPEIE